MSKLPCGCTPDASGYGYCGDCTRKLHEKIWSRMSEKRKRYDRQFAPEQSKALDEALVEFKHDRSCSCHISAPCDFCISASELTEQALKGKEQ